jgi:hypothetical protein
MPSSVNIESHVKNITLRYVGVSANFKYPKIKILNGTSNIEHEIEPENTNITLCMCNINERGAYFILEELIHKLLQL